MRLSRWVVSATVVCIAASPCWEGCGLGSGFSLFRVARFSCMTVIHVIQYIRSPSLLQGQKAVFLGLPHFSCAAPSCKIHLENAGYKSLITCLATSARH